MRGAVSIKHLAHHEPAITAEAIGIRVHGHWFQETIGGIALGLLGGGTVKGPLLGIREVATEIVHDHGFTAQALGRLVAIEPDVFQLMFAHLLFVCVLLLVLAIA